jgi:hypothetical protein
MNNIYIINESCEYNIILNFEENTFNIDSVIYKFDLCNKNEIKIIWSENNIESYYTEDSYLYFSKIELKDSVKIIFLIHLEWHDQALINLRTNKLNRIKNKDQYGTFIIEDNELIIDWNYWGKEKYYKTDYNSYLQVDYYINNYEFNNTIPIHIFIHICAIENWEEILKELLEEIKLSGLYDIIKNIHLGILGDINILENDIFKDHKFKILYIDKKLNLYETHTINHIKSFCDESTDEEIYILYIHTKGVRRAGNENVIKSWRKMMEYFLIQKHSDSIKYLSHYYTLGNNLINSHIYDKKNVAISDKHTLHYSGNFWWSKKSYINKLCYINLDYSENSYKTRFKSENWILSKYEEGSNKFGILYQDYTNTHPYHRYVFDNYKKNNIIIKNILI